MPEQTALIGQQGASRTLASESQELRKRMTPECQTSGSWAWTLFPNSIKPGISGQSERTGSVTAIAGL